MPTEIQIASVAATIPIATGITQAHDRCDPEPSTRPA
jgi:hypothetical protein